MAFDYSLGTINQARIPKSFCKVSIKKSSLLGGSIRPHFHDIQMKTVFYTSYIVGTVEEWLWNHFDSQMARQSLDLIMLIPKKSKE